MSDLDIHFIISAPRSGSTWITNALNQHPEIFATEHRLFGFFNEMWRNNDGTSSPRITFDAYTEAFAGHYFYEDLGLTRGQFMNQFQRILLKSIVRFGKVRANKPILIDKITPYPGTSQQVIDQINKFFPNAKIIQLIRDGRDVLTSGTFDWILKDSHGSDRFWFFVKQKEGMELKRFFDHQVICKWAQNWNETVEIFETEPPSLRIEYEDMKKDQSAELCKIFKLLGVDDSPDIARVASEKVTFKNTTGRESGDMDSTAKARKGMVGDWKNYFTHIDGKIFHAIAGPQLMTNGYESDPQWFERLPEQLSMVIEPLEPKSKESLEKNPISQEDADKSEMESSDIFESDPSSPKPKSVDEGEPENSVDESQNQSAE